MSLVRREGSALFTVVAATAALAVPVSLLALQAGAAYRADVYRADRIQAQALVQALWLQVADALASGELSVPGRTHETRVVNGVVQPVGPTGPAGRFDPILAVEAAAPGRPQAPRTPSEWAPPSLCGEYWAHGEKHEDVPFSPTEAQWSRALPWYGFAMRAWSHERASW